MRNSEEHKKRIEELTEHTKSGDFEYYLNGKDWKYLLDYIKELETDIMDYYDIIDNINASEYRFPKGDNQ